MVEPTPRCELCGHPMSVMDPALFHRCGYAAAGTYLLCHTDDHSCYVRWTVYGERPA